MEKTLVPTKFEGIADVRLERPLAELVSILLESEVAIIAEGIKGTLRESGNWLGLSRQGKECGLRLDYEASLPDPAYFSRLVGFAKQLSTSSGQFGQDFVLISSVRHHDGTERYFKVIKLRPAQTVLGRLSFCGDAAVLTGAEGPLLNQPDRRLSLYSLAIEVTLSVPAPKEVPACGDSLVWDGQLQLCPSCGVDLFGWRAVVLPSRSNLAVLEVKECMEINEQETIRVRVALGFLELPLRALLELRPGTRIEVQMPGPLEGVMQVGPVEWAQVELQVSPNGVALLVDKLITRPLIGETFAAH